MKAIAPHWLYAQFCPDIPMEGPHACYLCGGPCDSSISVVRALADTFNSHYLAQAPSSLWVCAACAWYLDNGADHPVFRKMSLVVQRDAWHAWKREDMKADILHILQCGMDTDAFLVVSLSKKKHIALQAPMNAASSRMIAVQVEEQVAHLDLLTWEAMDAAFMALLRLGHNKSEVLSGNLYSSTLRKHGRISEALQWSNALDAYRQSAALELVSYVTIVEEKEQPTHDGTDTRRDPSSLQPGTGDTSRGLGAAARGMERDRQRIQKQVPSRDMAAIRGEDSDGQSHHEQLSLFPE